MKEGPIGANKQAPGAAFLLGKVLNAFLLDHVDVDLELLRRLNNVIKDGTKTYGPGFVETMSREANRRNQPAYRYVEPFEIRPSEDLGRLASEHVRKGKFIGNPFFTKRLFEILDTTIRPGLRYGYRLEWGIDGAATYGPETWIDVPGHERFVKNLLAGVGGIDAVLFFVAFGVVFEVSDFVGSLLLLAQAPSTMSGTTTRTMDEAKLNAIRGMWKILWWEVAEQSSPHL
jgi:hypothetical protein